MPMNKKMAPAAAVLALCCATAPRDVAACGDKFLVIGRSAKPVPRARNRASVLLLLPADARLASAVRDMRMEATLKQAGHDVETVTEPVALSTLLATRRYDFVLTGIAAASATVREIAAAGGASPPAVVAIAVKADAATILAAQNQFGLVIEAPTRSVSYLKAIDAAMGRRRATASTRD